VVTAPAGPFAWWQLHRLRYAIEVDCDARVLKSGLDTGQFGETLIGVLNSVDEPQGSNPVELLIDAPSRVLNHARNWSSGLLTDAVSR
jgi:hypothetical protein